MDKRHKTLGVGTLSIPIILLGFLFGFSWNGFCLGDNILRFFGAHAWSNGTHYTVFYSLIFFIAALTLAYKWNTNYGAKVGRILSTTVVIFLLISVSYLG